MYSLDKKMTVYIKGIAIALMVIHHLFTGNTMYGLGLNAFAIACKICVGIYAFMTGFGYFYTKDKGYYNSFMRILNLLERYWIQMILIFFPLAVGGGFVLNPKNVIVNLFALRPNINWFSWYVYFYIFLMLVLPIYVKLCRNRFMLNVVVTVFISWLIEAAIHTLPWYTTNHLIGNLFDCFLYFPTAAIGYLIARHNIFGKIQEHLKSIQQTVFLPLGGMMLVVIAMLGRYNFSSILGLNLDVIYVPVFVFGVFQFLAWIKEKISERSLFVLKILGTYSTELWFLHSIFFSPETNEIISFNKLLWLPQNALLVFLWCFILCLPVVVVLNWLARKIDSMMCIKKRREIVQNKTVTSKLERWAK